MRIAQSLEHARIIDTAIARNRKAAFQHSLTERKAFRICLLHLFRTDVLQMHMTDARAEQLCCLYGVLAGERKMSGVKAQIDVARIGIIHQTLGLLDCLHDRRHVMVIAQLKAAVCCNLSQLIETIAQLFPFLFCGNRLIIAKHGASLCKQQRVSSQTLTREAPTASRKSKVLINSASFSSYGLEHKKLENHCEAILMPRKSKA